jgi:RNA polymerase sigma-70 factor (ECF subfamily)
MGSERPTPSPSSPAEPGPAQASGASPSSSEIYPQLSAGQRVSTSVTSVAMAPHMPGTARLDRRTAAAQAVPNVGLLAGLSDAEVMLRVRAGDESAFAFLVQKYRRPMLSFMYRMVHNQAAAEDLAQEVFLRVYRSRETYTANAKFSTWLYRIATNLAVNHARDTRHDRPEVSMSLDAPDTETGLMPDLPDGTPNVEENILRRERLAAIRSHVQALPERQRMAVIMHKYQGMDYRQIAEVLHLSESATKSLLFRAYESLREKLKDFV